MEEQNYNLQHEQKHVPLKPVPTMELKQEQRSNRNGHTLGLGISPVTSVSSYAVQDSGSSLFRRLHPNLPIPLEESKPPEMEKTANEICARANPVNHTSSTRWQQQSNLFQPPITPISIDTSQFSHLTAGPLSAPGALSSMVAQTAAIRGEERSHMSASFKSQHSTLGGTFPFQQMPLPFPLNLYLPLAPTPLCPPPAHIPYNWGPTPSYLMCQELYKQPPYLWNAWPTLQPMMPIQQQESVIEVVRTEEIKKDLKETVEKVQRRHPQLTCMLSSIQVKESQDLVKQETKMTPLVQPEQPESKLFSGLEVLTQGVDIISPTKVNKEETKPDRNLKSNTLNALCDAVEKIEQSENEPYAKSAPNSPRLEEFSVLRSRSLDSCATLTQFPVSRSYKSVESEREARAFIASKSKKVLEQNSKLCDIKMQRWESEVKQKMAIIQHEYKEKYKKLYKLQHQKKAPSPQKTVKKILPSELPNHPKKKHLLMKSKSHQKNQQPSIKECWKSNKVTAIKIDAKTKSVVHNGNAVSKIILKPNGESHNNHYPHDPHHHHSKRSSGKKHAKKRLEEWSFASKVIPTDGTPTSADKIVNLPVLRLKKRSSSETPSQKVKVQKIEEGNTKEDKMLQLHRSELKEGTRVLIQLDSYFHPGKITEIRPPDIYGVIVDHERRQKPHIFSAEDILLKTTRDITPQSITQVPVGQRVCAFWSKTYKHLYPGHIGDPDLIDQKLSSSKFVNIELDDGDGRDISIEDVRILPKIFPFEEQASPDAPLPSSPYITSKDIGSDHQEHKTGNIDKKVMPKKVEKKVAKRQSSVNSGIASFLPANHLWTWDKKDHSKKSSKTTHKRIIRGSETLKIGDCAVFLSAGKLDQPFIGRLDAMWETKSGHKRVRVQWFYHGSEVKAFGKVIRTKGALYESNHYDENDIQTISHKCRVHSYSNYKNIILKNSPTPPEERSQKMNEEIESCYFLTGHYDPLKRSIVYQKDVAI